VVLADTGLPGRLNGQVLDPSDPGVRNAWQTELERIRNFAWPEQPA
jgi:hypothetical protein